MNRRRVLMLGLDGYDPVVGASMMAEGRLPALRALSGRSARFALEHGPAKFSGLAWEHVSTGLAPDDAGRWAAVFFDPRTYAVWQQPTALAPFPASLSARTVVVDAPYYDLKRDPRAQGIVAWGTHDPGVGFATRPESLAQEIQARFGPYPASDWIYGFSWPSVTKTQTMGAAIVKGIEVRAELTRWLLAERLPDWDLAIVIPTELHSAIEALWHGFDKDHPLNAMPSAAAARDGLVACYDALDRLVGKLVADFSDATIIAFNMHGMGPNFSDVPSMLLFPELLFRHAFGTALLGGRPDWQATNGAVPPLAENEGWEQSIRRVFRNDFVAGSAWQRIVRRVFPVRRQPKAADATGGPSRQSIDWMPAAWYKRYWPRMQAFALPAFYDGRVRINLAGREGLGSVRPEHYAAVCREIETMVRACRDIRTGEPIVEHVSGINGRDPRDVDPTEADLAITWRLSTLGFDHPTLGRIGPVPYRRTGGHTGGHGMAWLCGSELPVGDHGVRSSFDVVPTVVELLGEPRPARLSGHSLLSASGAGAPG